MLKYITTLFRIDPKYKKELQVAGWLLVAGYVFLLVFVYIAFNGYDAAVQDEKPKSGMQKVSNLKHQPHYPIISNNWKP